MTPYIKILESLLNPLGHNFGVSIKHIKTKFKSQNYTFNAIFWSQMKGFILKKAKA